MNHKTKIQNNQIFCIECKRNLKPLEITSIIIAIMSRLELSRKCDSLGVGIKGNTKFFENELRKYRHIREETK